jgi:hypothetical protein
MIGTMKNFLERLWSVLISLKLAVIVIATLAVSLMIATVIESKFDAKTAQYLVYRAGWFYGILTLLGCNILAVAISRYPWKRKHFAFLMAHAGILMILTGSWLTYVRGIDGSLRISEGEVNSAVELDNQVLLFTRHGNAHSEEFKWMPEFVAKNFKPIDYPDYNIRIEKFIADAEPKISFNPVEADTDKTQAAKANAAIQIRILGSPMGGAPEIWLWAADAGWSSQKIGPVRFLIRSEDQKDLSASTPAAPALPSDSAGEGTQGMTGLPMGAEARLDFVVNKKGELHYEATSIRGEKKSGKIVFNGKELPLVNPGWKMPIQVQVKKFIPMAVNHTEYVPLTVKPEGMGSALPNPAIQISLINNPSSRLWLGLGDRAEFTDLSDNGEISVGYFPRRVILPFALRLKLFEMKHNPGTNDPSAYSSYIQEVDEMQKGEAEMESLPVHHITMNEPMDAKGYTFYQASYLPDFPRPTTTILSVNYDPGRVLKYLGSLLLVGGAILLYALKAIQKKPKAVGVEELVEN